MMTITLLTPPAHLHLQRSAGGQPSTPMTIVKALQQRGPRQRLSAPTRESHRLPDLIVELYLVMECVKMQLMSSSNLTLSTIPPCAVPGYVQAVRQVGAGRDQARVCVHAATGEPDK